MKGYKEQSCLDFIKDKMFSRNGELIKHPFTGKTCTEVKFEEFVKEQIWYIYDECNKSYFGLLKEDRTEIEQILYNASPNRDLYQFPDFIFDIGYIEHFQISSSKTTKKGALHLKKMNCFINMVNEEAKILKQDWTKNPDFNRVRSKRWMINNPEHSHDFLIKSFKKSWENHLMSLEKYEGKKNIGIFMIEYADFALSMFENIYEIWKDGMSQGDMKTPENFHYYRLTRDKELLNYMYQYKDIIKYVIFVYVKDLK